LSSDPDRKWRDLLSANDPRKAQEFVLERAPFIAREYVAHSKSAVQLDIGEVGIWAVRKDVADNGPAGSMR